MEVILAKKESVTQYILPNYENRLGSTLENAI